MIGQKYSVFVLLALICLTGVYSASLVQKCKSDDSKCAKESAQAIVGKFAAGLPEYNVKTLDPITFSEIDASTSNLKLVLNDVVVTGLKDCVMKKVKVDKPNKKLQVKVQCNGKLDGRYEMKGQLLILPIEGKGPVHVTLRKAEISIEADMGEIEKGGAKYWDVKGWKHGYTLKDKADVVFENLFEGNKILGQAARDMISNSGNEIVLEVGPPVIKAIVDAVVENVKSFFYSVPAEELSID